LYSIFCGTHSSYSHSKVEYSTPSCKFKYICGLIIIFNYAGFSTEIPGKASTLMYHRRSIAPPSSHALSSRLYRTSQPSLTMSTPNLTAIGLGRSRSTSSFTDRKSLEKSKLKQSAARAKRNLKKQLSKLERKPSKNRLYKVNLPKSRRLYDETEISTESETSSTSNVEHLFSQLSTQHQHSLR